VQNDPDQLTEAVRRNPTSRAEGESRITSVNLLDPYLTCLLFADCQQALEKHGSLGRTRTYNLPVNSLVRSGNPNNLAVQMTTRGSLKELMGMKAVTLI
jgi:hypothetical protein